MIRRLKLCSFLISLFYFLFLLLSCSFDYGSSESSADTLPNLIMENVEYVRVRSSDPIARIQAERLERYEKQGIMELSSFTFEQYGGRGEEINAAGSAGNASFYISSGDIFMNHSVIIEIKTEEITLETEQLEWQDQSRLLSSGENTEINIYMDNGTHITGTGLQADARRRTWEITGGVSGVYVYEEEANEEQADE